MRIAIVVIAAVFFVGGCEHKGAISPQERVITKPIAPKFDLAGIWVAEPDFALPQDTNQPITIRKTAEGVFAIAFPATKGLEIELRTTALGNQEDYAIADVVASANGEPWLRYLGIVAEKDGTLRVWWIESKNLAKRMHTEGHSAVIEHGAFGSKVFADSNDLLDCIVKHSRKLVGKPAIFIRQAK